MLPSTDNKERAMIKVTVVELDGYKDWTPSKVTQGEVPVFNQDECLKLACTILEVDEEDKPKSLKQMFGDALKIKGNTITCNGEEGGVMFIAHI
jgi:hypothetical protein